MAVDAPRRRRPIPISLRILTAALRSSGRDTIGALNSQLVRAGAEVIHLDGDQSAPGLARAATQEDVHAIAIAADNRGDVTFLRQLTRELRARRAGDIRVFVDDDALPRTGRERALRPAGIERVFAADTPLPEKLAVLLACAKPRKPDRSPPGDRALGRAITLAEQSVFARRAGTPRAARSSRGPEGPGRSTLVLGVAGPAGSGRSTLIDALCRRFLATEPRRRVAVLVNARSDANSGGALRIQRGAAINAGNERVFFRTIATRRGRRGVSAALPEIIAAVRSTGEFDLVLVESAATARDEVAFGFVGPAARGIDAMLLVMSPGATRPRRLADIPLLAAADLVALNKGDDPCAANARQTLASLLARQRNPPPLHVTVATRDHDRGVSLLYAAIADLAAFDEAGGERACQLRLHG